MGDLVDGRELVGEEGRVPEHRQQHRRPQRETAGPRGDRRQQGQRVVARLGDQGIADPHRIEPDLLGQIPEFEDAVGVVHPHHHALAGGEEIAQLDGHDSSLPGKAATCRNRPAMAIAGRLL